MSSYINEHGHVIVGHREKRRRVSAHSSSSSSSSSAAALATSTSTTASSGTVPKRLVVVLEHACLELVQGESKRQELLNVDDHQQLLRKKGRDMADARPDITHQCLLNLLDSPLCKAGLMQIFVHTARNVLIEVSPHTRIPRTFKRFAGVMVQLLRELKVVAADNSHDVLMRVVKNPIEAHLPPGARRVASSSHATDLKQLDDLVAELSPADEPVVFVIGAFAKGDFEPAYVDTRVSFSQYPLSAALACAKVSSAFEKQWGVL
jgi:rRNA small subunit pseudouridine methyltransferase Nep1